MLFVIFVVVVVVGATQEAYPVRGLAATVVGRTATKTSTCCWRATSRLTSPWCFDEADDLTGL